MVLPGIRMTAYGSPVWLGYLTHLVITNCLVKAKGKCAACKNNITTSPLLHYHLQSSLLEKMKDNFEEVRGPMISEIELCFNSYVQLYGLDVEKNNYIFTGQTFLLLSTPESIYFGRYINEELYAILFPQANPEAVKILSATPRKCEENKSKKRRENKPTEISKLGLNLGTFDMNYS